MFWDYFVEGFLHILDPNGYDHLIFLVALCAAFDIRYFGRVLILATAFTVGHSITLALATLDIFRMPGDIVEFLIPVTILLTAFRTVLFPKRSDRKLSLAFVAVVLFGFIHGMGFSTLLRMKLSSGESLWQGLLAFNLGIEAAQLLIVTVFLLLTTALQATFTIRTRDWILGLSAMCCGVALVLVHENWLW